MDLSVSGGHRLADIHLLSASRDARYLYDLEKVYQDFPRVSP